MVEPNPQQVLENVNVIGVAFTIPTDKPSAKSVPNNLE